MVRLVLTGLVALLLVGALGIGAYKAYQTWDGRRLVRRSEAYLSAGDVRSAALTAHRAFQLSHTNVEACRILARIAEATSQSAAVEWRKSALLAAPDSDEDKIALAKAAVQFDQLPLAEATLAKISKEGRVLPAFYDLQGQLALTRKDLPGAEKNLSEAVRLEPANKSFQFRLATIQLQSGAEATRGNAERSLRGFLDDQELRAPAARVLRDNAAKTKNGPTFLEMAGLLAKYPEANFRDRVAYVHALHVLNHPDFAGKLTDLEKESQADPEKLAEILSWMSSNGLTLLAMQWIKELPNEILQKQSVPLTIADCYVSMKDWPGLQDWCRKGEWGNLDFFRHAYLCRAFREQGDNLSAESEWNMATRAAEANGERLHALQQGVVRWGWKKEAENLLWKLADNRDKQAAALGALYQYYLDNGDTQNLYRVVARLSDLKPEDEHARNNLAQLALLLNVDTERAHALAEQLYRKSPGDSVFASTYAFSLYRRGLYQQALKVMNEIKPDELEKPAFAGYYGVVLAAAGDKAKAGEYLQRGSSAPLLPEERALFDNAQNKINQ